MTDGTLSASDIALLNGDGAGSFNSLIWLFAILCLFSGGGFGGFGGWGNNAAALGYENLATSQEIQNGFNNQNVQAQTRDILAAVNSGTAQSVAATNQVFHDVVNNLGDKYSELARDIANVQMGVQQGIANQNECCCSTKQLIQATSAATDAQIAQSKYDTSMQMAQMEARLTSKMDANEIQSLRDQVNQLQLQNATSGILRFPNSWSYNGGYFPPINGCPCGGNI